ncbi:type I-E CRISPR-associated protein Cas6/Cse3/CasE [Streptomyces sedi]|uniref:Type I-E CRISPR-associated protein Cas6/Cse3/CasE n=1 Tax=Streptomyces sedi TaxID=555059 RepID=A0A5C4UTT1_9ACTN|nr:type I-E CRISPR-associated protein Cas6/Cse3/CasE [Streptomyces sedi]TNM27067.1 type I-E CRISPR-associated protein Cas6/Cse3/CasE [Streptomyces sedi]
MTNTTTTAHLARITLNTRSREALKDLRDANNAHRRVLTLFPDSPTNHPRADGNVLYRIEHTPGTPPTLLIQSTTSPINRNALPPRYATNIEHRDLTPLLNWITTDHTVHYRIHADPTATIRDPQRLHTEGLRRATARGLKDQEAEDYAQQLVTRHAQRRRGLRLPLTTQEDILTWWHRQAERAGLHPLLTLDAPTPTTPATRPDGEARFTLTRFDGIARITNPTALHTALTTGIGPARSFGAGLLTIAPHNG